MINPEYVFRFDVEAEDRIWAVGPEDRSFEVNAEDREIVIEARADVDDVHAEPRAVTVEDEGRTAEPLREPEIEA